MDTADPLRCLSVRQPYAWAICVGEKTVENRGWTTTHRGRIAIHAGARDEEIAPLLAATQGLMLPDVFALGAIIGTVEVADIVEYDDRLDSDWASGPYCWLLKNPQLLKDPIPARGRQSLYRLPEDVQQQVEAATAQPLDDTLRHWIHEVRMFYLQQW